MRSLRAWLLRLGGLWKKSSRDKEFADELESNLQLHIEDNIKAGMKPEEARRSALLKFGGVDDAKEAWRDRRGIPFLETLARDVRYAFRVLGQNKGWTAVAILSLALGIGANTALFSLVNGALLAKLPVHNPDELVSFRWAANDVVWTGMSESGYTPPEPGFERVGSAFSLAAFEQLRSESQSIADIFGFAHPRGLLSVVAGGEAHVPSAQYISGNYYGALGIAAVSGRLIAPRDDVPGADPVVVLSQGYWQRRFGADPQIIGSIITINNVAFTVAGISPDSLGDLMRIDREAPELSIPLAMEPVVMRDRSQLNQPLAWWIKIMGRLTPDVKAEAIQSKLDAVFERSALSAWQTSVASLSPGGPLPPGFNAEPRPPQLRVVNGSRGVYDLEPNNQTTLRIFTFVFGILLVIVCINLANLMLSRGATRQKETALRLAIGATRPRLIRQFLTESLVLAALGGGVGFLVAYGFERLFSVWGLAMWTSEREAIDWRVLVFGTALTLLTGLFFGIAPALRSSKVAAMPAIREGSIQLSHSRPMLGSLLLVSQVAMSLALLVTAGLFLQTVRNLQHIRMGFNPNNILLFTLDPQPIQYDAVRNAALNQEIIDRLRTLPGVLSVSYSDYAVLSGDWSEGGVVIPGRETSSASIGVMNVHPAFFDTMEIPLKLGRTFTSEPVQAGQPRPTIVNETFAKTFFPGSNPIGMRLGANSEIEIIGMVEDAPLTSLRDAAPPMRYNRYRLPPTGERTFQVRTGGDPAAILPSIRDAMHQLAPDLPLLRVSTQKDLVSSLFKFERTFAFTSSLFGGLALAISMIGLFGLMSYAVVRRTREIGIRMSLGAQRQTILRSVIKETLGLVVVGIVIGLGIAFGANHVIASHLFGVTPNDPTTIAIAVSLMIAVAVLASYLPARRASHVDPMIALRHE